jgi:eukaryotic-like serine/threonine-protein kinase
MIIMTGTIVYGPTGSEYEVLDYLGSGNFGVVHKVKQRGGSQALAMKSIPTPFTDEAALKAFLNEGNLAVGIRHQNVIEYLFFHDGTKHPSLPPYILMEYADGGTLENRLDAARRDNKQFSSAELIEIFKQLVAGMVAINEKLVHRDIKPDNILVSEGILKISDFGLSKVVTEATRKSTFKGFGCLAYMAPEAWALEKNTPQLDIYAMGIVFYQLATLRHPFDIRTPDQQKWMEAHLYQPVPAPDRFNSALAPKLANIILRMVEKSTAKRFSDWAEIQELLSVGPSAPAPADSLVEEMLKRRLRQDSAAQANEAEQRRKRDEKVRFCKLVLSQAEATIASPLADLVDRFNREYSGEKAKLTVDASDSSLRRAIWFPSTKSITLEFRVLLPEHFVRDIPPDFRHRSVRREVCIPKYEGRYIQGWGRVEGSDGRGFNVLLVEQRGQIYGEFLMLTNSMGVPSAAAKRQEPFAFKFDELEAEMNLLGAMHIYSSAVRPFSIDYMFKFIAEYA